MARSENPQELDARRRRFISEMEVKICDHIQANCISEEHALLYMNAMLNIIHVFLHNRGCQESFEIWAETFYRSADECASLAASKLNI